jgi:hypothetical protein
MKPFIPVALLATLASTLSAQNPPPPAPASLAESFAKGKLSVYARLRWEDAEQSNLKDATAYTLDSRVGFTTAPFNGFQAMVEGENVSSLGDSDDYNAAGTNPGGAGRTVIGDPPSTAVNQAWLSYAASGVTLKVGRQRIALDNQRFIGDAGWRQNLQTFDAATLAFTPAKDFAFSYSYFSRVNRVFGNKAPQRDFTGDAHLLNASMPTWAGGKFTVYGYMFDFDNSAANSSNTFGASLTGTVPLSGDWKASYRLEYASQEDAGANPLNYTADYRLVDLGAANKVFNIGAGYEILGSDAGVKGFATPLASLHAFNGWADVFSATPAKGLRDLYFSAGATLPGGFPLKAVYHDYKSDSGDLDYGTEWDAVVTHKIAKYWTLMAKVARYSAKPPFFDTDKFWLQVEFVY